VQVAHTDKALTHLRRADLDALGPDGDSVRVVEELEARIDALQHQVMDAKERSVRMQMYAIADAADLDNLASSGKVKLHLGCGRNTLPGWLNADLYGWRLNSGDGWDVNRAKERVLSINVGTTPLPLPDGSCEFVYTSHMLEHLIHPAQTRLVMEEVHRVLAPGGTVRVVVPDAGVWLRGYAEHDASFFATVRQEWPFWDWAMLDSAAGSRLDYILPYLGASSLQGHLAGDHQFGFDEASLRALMVSAGFGSDAVIRSKYQQSPHPALLVDNASEAAAAKFASPGRGEVFLSLFIEATKSFEPLRHAPTSASASLVASSPSYVTSSSPPSAHHQPAMTGSSSRSGGRVRRALQWVVKRIVGAN
jgi:SAM-dependent methyltransferase